MTNFNHFSETEIPYTILSDFGLTQEMIDDLPQNVMQRLLSSRATPILPLVMENDNGEKIQSFARIKLVRMPDGSVDVSFIPQWREKALEQFEEWQREALLHGDVVIIELADKGECYAQYDETIKQVMTVPVKLIEHNLDILADVSQLDEETKSNLKQGKIVELLNGNDETISIGIDLNEMTGCRISDGNAELWRIESKADVLPKYNFGIYGCWMCDEITNLLSYMPEEEYSESMYEEMKRVGQQKSATVQMGGFHR